MNVGPISNPVNLYASGIQGTETVVPVVIESAQTKTPKKSDGTIQNTSNANNSGQQRGGNPALYKKPEPAKAKTRDLPKATSGSIIQDELTFSPQAQVLLRNTPRIVRFEENGEPDDRNHLDLQI